MAPKDDSQEQPKGFNVSRRNFLKTAGVSSLATAVFKWPSVRLGPAQPVREHLTSFLKSVEQPCC